MKIESLFLLLLALVSCKSSNEMKTKANDVTSNNSNMTRPYIMVYKTKNDYYNLVPILLSEDKKEIISYPDPKDLKAESSFLLPTLLKGGYLLDNKGISKNVAFLKYTYQEYSKLEYPPTLNVLYDNIIDKNPLLELYNCRSYIENYDKEVYLNKIIDKENLSNECKIIKLD